MMPTITGLFQPTTRCLITDINDASTARRDRPCSRSACRIASTNQPACLTLISYTPDSCFASPLTASRRPVHRASPRKRPQTNPLSHSLACMRDECTCDLRPNLAHWVFCARSASVRIRMTSVSSLRTCCMVSGMLLRLPLDVDVMTSSR